MNHNMCVAHRGWSGRAPENTLAAFRLAMSEPYVQWAELDVQLSKDGVPVVIHDFTLKRTTNGKGKVKDYTFAELQKLDAGSWFGPEYAGERIPSLDEVLGMTGGRLRLNIELKTEGDMYPGMEQRVLDLVHQHHLQHDVCLTSFEPDAVREAKRLAPNVPAGLITGERSGDYVAVLQDLGADFLSIYYKRLTKEHAAKLSEHHIGMMAWTVDDPIQMRRLAEMHPDILICTNHPDRWVSAFGEEK